MSLKTFVKISRINNLSDARYCAGMYVNLMGFSLEDYQPNYISPEKFGEITGWLSGLEYVGEFETKHPDAILETLISYPHIKHIEIQEEIHLKVLVNTSYALILKQNIKENVDLENLIAKSQSYSDHNVTLHLISDTLQLEDSILEKIKTLAEKCQVLLGFGLEANSVENVIEMTGIRGISLQGGDEIKPGLKDFDELADILEALDIDN